MADNEAAILAAAKKLPFDERLVHKTWKVRSELFEDVRTGCTKAFSSDDPILAKSGGWRGLRGGGVMLGLRLGMQV